jgi:hypothetical protein
VVPAGSDPGSAGYRCWSLTVWDHQGQLQKDVVWVVMCDIKDQASDHRLTMVYSGILIDTIDLPIIDAANLKRAIWNTRGLD